MFQKSIGDSTGMPPSLFRSCWGLLVRAAQQHYKYPHQLVWTVASSASLEARDTAAIAISAQARLFNGARTIPKVNTVRVLESSGFEQPPWNSAITQPASATICNAGTGTGSSSRGWALG